LDDVSAIQPGLDRGAACRCTDCARG